MPLEYRGYELFGNKTFPFTLERPAKPIKTTLFALKKKKTLVWIKKRRKIHLFWIELKDGCKCNCANG